VPHLCMAKQPDSRRAPIAATPMAFVKAMLISCERLQHDPTKALADAQIDPVLIDRPDARITAAQMERLSDRLMRELDDEALGWFTRRLPWGSYGMLARASITSPNLMVAMQRWCRHHALLTKDIQLQLSRHSPDSVDCAMVTLIEADLGTLAERRTQGVLPRISVSKSVGAVQLAGRLSHSPVRRGLRFSCASARWSVRHPIQRSLSVWPNKNSAQI
jgi:hypothetical protein